MYWMHISWESVSFIQFKITATGLIPVLRYLHSIIAYTIMGRFDSQTVITTTDVRILSHTFRGISVDLTYIFTRQAQGYTSSTWKKVLVSSPSSRESLCTSVLILLGLVVAALLWFRWIIRSFGTCTCLGGLVISLWCERFLSMISLHRSMRYLRSHHYRLTELDIGACQMLQSHLRLSRLIIRRTLSSISSLRALHSSLRVFLN